MPAPVPTLFSRRRQIAFKLTAFSLPFLLFAVLELALRLFGYGYPTHFFLPGRASDKPVRIENQQFGWRFFPPALARAPLPLAVPAEKPAGIYRIFILGESAAMGHPAPAFSFARILEVLLRERYPGAKFEVINTAMTAINSHVIVPLARECAREHGDLWIVYMGNNEVVGPFGAGTVFGRQALSVPLVRANLWVKTTRIGQLMDAGLARLLRKPSAPMAWEGMEMFLEQKVRQDDPRLADVYAHFQKNLADILRTGSDAGAKVIVSTVVSNLKDCAPFASLHPAGLLPVQIAEWEKIYQAGIALEAAGKFVEAAEQYRQAAQVDEQYADLPFRRGRCEWALGKYDEARRHFELARDFDALRFRADSRINQIIRQVSANGGMQDIYFVDAADALARQSPHRVPGEESLYEHVHFNFDGNYWLARTIAEKVTPLLPAPIAQRASASATWLTMDECAQRLAWTKWNRFQVEAEALARMQQAPFTNQLDHAERDQRWRQQLAQLRAFTQPDAAKRTIAAHQQALGFSPNDWVLHENFAKLLEQTGDLDGALAQWQQVRQFMPHYFEAYYVPAQLRYRQAKYAEAASDFSKALEFKPHSPQALNGLGLALAHQGKYAEAAEKYTQALALKPDIAEGHINLGLALFSLGKVNDAIAHHREALRLDPNSAAAHINLGKFLERQGEIAEAIAHYQQAVLLQSNNPVAHFNLANALSAQNRHPEAVRHFAEVVRLQPKSGEAHLYLGIALALHGQIQPAAAQFAEAVRLEPSDSEARLHYGVALQKLGRKEEAIAQFREALRLDPANKLVQEQLKRLLSAPAIKRPEREL